MARSTRDGPTLLAQRVATAAVGIPAIVALIWIGGWTYAIVVAVALAVAAAEFQHFRHRWYDPETIVSLALVAAIMIAAQYGAVAASIAIASGLLGVLAVVPRLREEGVHSGGIAALWIVAGALYLGVLGSTIILLRELDNGRDWVYLALFSTFAVDTAAYVSGRAIGRRKMAPTISPKKTWEGFAGGYAGGFAAVLLLNYVLGLRIDAAPAFLIGATLPAAAAAGDLLESWLKRRAGVKDASDLIPGHGGVLDRLDSLLFTFPVVYVVARWIA